MWERSGRHRRRSSGPFGLPRAERSRLDGATPERRKGAEALNVEITLLVGGAASLLAIVWLSLRGTRPSAEGAPPPVLSPGVQISPTPLLTESDLSLYNMIRLAVQDQFLVLAQVPLLAFVSVEAMGKARAQVLNRMALKRVDFVLLHPGSRQVEQVVQIEEPSPRPHQVERQRVIEAVLDAAGIKVVKVRAQKAYSTPDLAALLGLQSEE
jgi:hypothetical protein